ncbi:ATP-binding protein [Actinomadura sp. NAK00032]|uniref:AlbA family DNA-binding domain-containing protein n=1 Tax=Actinomadura sp. NAK00032 TaxID=2742128 RepID=UPI0015903187|nr:ATP-binding protein [Actinomadura sp. NAK00032]QKW36246.1 ATP-binding protein [Actinomadura sp. NAK00032]
MTSIYLSASQPRWTPQCEADLQTALDGGLIGESHYIDLKEVPSSKGGNKESARDMASFALDGGTLIVGIAEDKENRVFTLSPQPLKGLAEKMEQIARSIPDPPLNVVTREIESGADPGMGYLIIHIPASPAAPHMVDGHYWGRGDKTKYKLADAEVVRLHERRRIADRDALALLQEEIDDDPIPEVIHKQAHLFLVAQPLAGRPDLLLEFTSASSWNVDLHHFIQKAYAPDVQAAVGSDVVSPTLGEIGNGFRRSRGIARATPNLADRSAFNPTTSYHPENALELQVHEDGGLRLFFSRLSDVRGQGSRPDEQVIIDAAAVIHTRRFLALVVAAGEQAGYFGNWALALGATGLRGLRAAPGRNSWGDGPPYDRDTYSVSTATTWAELNQSPGAITRRLTGPLLRALGTESSYSSALTDPEPDNEPDGQ